MMVLMNDSDIKHVRITIAITTFRRPAQLATLLATVNDRVAELPGHIEARLVVVDNDPDASARPVVAFTHGHLSRFLMTRLLDLPASAGAAFHNDTASIGMLRSDRGRFVLTGWNLRAP